MKRIKRLCAILSAACLLLSGCTKAAPAEPTGSTDSASAFLSSAISASSAITTSSAATTVSEPNLTIPENVLGKRSDLLPEVTVDKYKVPEGEGMDFVKKLKLGWNLGNTFDATGTDITPEKEMSLESSWCGIVTKPENIAAVKGAGFETIRIPVSWHNHVDENFKISEAWMNRVKEVVDWAIECGLYVILNTHHDNAAEYYYPDSAHLESSQKYLSTIWQQIAETFKDYDEHLVLESLNEPRLVDTKYEWWMENGNEQCRDAVLCINKLNQLFVDTVRAAGGKNADRWLLCPGYDASAEGALNDEFVLPNDPKNRVIVSVHAYLPYNFALDNKGTADWSIDNDADRRSVTDFMDRLYGKFIQNGTPVIIGEFGALNKDNLEARVQFTAFYTAAARARGISCCWWDNNAFYGAGEKFGLLTRGDNFFMYPEIVQAMVENAE
ncbi:MAG: glycoside hydrolase family 5 protein [Oscillospiraceae bacterium]|nr:glycoside hydrolase family 5 protein [Oscillospiraceae bacterium]